MATTSIKRKIMHTWTKPSRWSQIFLLEDNATRSVRRRLSGVKSANPQISIRVHRIDAKDCVALDKRSYKSGDLVSKTGGRAKIAIKLLDATLESAHKAILVAGTSYGCNLQFIEALVKRRMPFALEIRPSSNILFAAGPNSAVHSAKPAQLLDSAVWESFQVDAPYGGETMTYSAAEIGRVLLPEDTSARLLAAQVGGIPGVHRGTIFCVSTEMRATPCELLHAVGWVRWISQFTRRSERAKKNAHVSSKPATNRSASLIRARPNNKNARQYDVEISQVLQDAPRGQTRYLQASPLNVVELFAGAGGMGLGFLMAHRGPRHYRLVYSGEVHPIYVETLRQNHALMAEHSKHLPFQKTPERTEPIDLRSPEAFATLKSTAKKIGDIHVLVGGPPCQGFSNANRNSWSSGNPHNQLVDVFLDYALMLRPQVFLMENVQGILWTQAKRKSRTQVGVVDHLSDRFSDAGYTVFPKLLDAAWYGVPQFRSRFFLFGVRKDLGLRPDDFGAWGPFPRPTHGPGTSRPYTTVQDAISDLPSIGNGHSSDESMYQSPTASGAANVFLEEVRRNAPSDTISDHITSKHAEYVLDRYKQIPAGGNWRDIAHTLTNYANSERTHSNIYRRLTWHEPSITIGHYRKSMLVHPSQNRGLSLREACRLQSFPDWFRFVGSGRGGLSHKQQQLANAVCPLVTKAIAEFILDL